MLTVIKSIRNVVTTNVGTVLQRSISTTSPKLLKKIRETQDGNRLVIEGVIVPSPREKFFVKTDPNSKACPLCRTNLDIKHTDVLILSQFVRSDGCMLPRRITGLCKIQQKRVSTMVTMAHKAGLMPNLKPKNSTRDPTKRRDWRKLNTYFDEKTIKFPKYYRWLMYQPEIIAKENRKHEE